MSRFVAVTMAVGCCATSARADKYVIPPDYRITCIDLSTGRKFWETKPPEMSAPKISLIGDVVLAECTKTVNRQKTKVVYLFDALNGRLLKKKLPAKGKKTGPLKRLSRNLTSSDGTKFEYKAGNTRHLIANLKNRKRIVQRLDSFPFDIHIAGDLAIFTFCGGFVGPSGGGEVYAWNLKTKNLNWEFDASSKLPRLGDSAYTSIDVDGTRVLVSTDQTLFALEAKSGKMIWMTKLPRQGIRRYDSPWTVIARHGDIYLIECYDDLFALRAKDGKLLWSYDCGPFGGAWPTVLGNRVFVATRAGKATLASASSVSPRKHVNTAFVVSRDDKSASGYSWRFMSRRDIPRGSAVWWSMRHPPRANKDVEPRITVKLIEDFDGEQSAIIVDLTHPLNKNGNAYLKFGMMIDKVVLLVDGKPVLTKIKPGSALKRKQ